MNFLDGIKGLKINGEFLGNDILIPHSLYFKTYIADSSLAVADTYRNPSFYPTRSMASSAQTVANSIRATPLIISRPVTLTAFAVAFASPPGGSKARFCIAYDDGNCYPGRVVQGSDIGEIDPPTATPPFYYNQKISLKPGLYWFCRLTNATVNMDGALDLNATGLLGKRNTDAAANDNIGYNISFTFGAFPSIIPSSYTMLPPIAAQSPVPKLNFLTESNIPIERFNEARLFGKKLVNKQDPQRNIQIFSTLQHRINDKTSYYTNAWNGTFVTSSLSANTIRGSWMLVTQTIYFDEIRAENTSSTGGALYSIGIYSMKRRRHQRGGRIVSTYYPDKLIVQANDFDGSTNGVKSKVVSRKKLERGLYCVCVFSNASLNYRTVNESHVPADAPYYGFSQTYGKFRAVFPGNATINPSGAAAGILIGLRPA